MRRGKSSFPSLPSPRRRDALIALWIILAFLFILVGYRGWSTYRHVRALRAHVAELRGIKPSTLASASSLLAAVQQDVRALRRDLALPLALAPHLAWVPKVGPTIASTPQLYSAGELLLSALTTAWNATEDYALAYVAATAKPKTLDDAPASLVREAQTLVARGPDLQAAAADARRAAQLIRELETARLVPRLADPLSRLQPLTPLLTASFEGLALAPQLLALPEDHAILLLAQNNDELRPTGGFISGIGAVQITQGFPKLISLADSYRVEDWNTPHLDPPEPLRKYMGIDLWVTRDGNWWPDFPTSAQAVSDLFTRNQGIPVAGVVAVNMQAAEVLLEALTPLTLPDGISVASGEVEKTFRQSWSLDLSTLVTEGVVITSTQPFTALDIELSLSYKSGQGWFDSIELEDLTRPGSNLVLNPSFEQDADLDKRPDSWTVSGLTQADGLVDDLAHAGQRSLHLVGDLQSEKRLTQRIPLNGAKGARLRLNGMARADNISSGEGDCALSLTFVPAGTTLEPQRVEAGFPALTHDWASAGSSKILGEWWAHRKDFMNLSIQAAARRITSAPSEVRWLDLLAAVKSILDERQVQFYMASPDLQDLIERYGWAGALAEVPGDFLMLVDTNVGYNKVTANVDQAIAYSVVIEPSGRVQGELTIIYHNRSAQLVRQCDKDKQYLPTYDSLTQGCYWDYVRVYLPQGTSLRSGEGGDEPFQLLSESGRAVFATSLELQPGEERVLRLRYTLPDAVRATDRYELFVQKQSGTESIPLQITIQGNKLATIQDSALEPSEFTAGRAVFRTDLRIDRHLVLVLGR